MLFPIYVIETGDGFVGRSPLIDVAFRASSLADLFADARAACDVLTIEADKRRQTPEELIAGCDGTEPYVEGEWTILPIGLAIERREPRERRNVSIATRTAQRIEVAAKSAGMTFSGWLSTAASEKLARGG